MMELSADTKFDFSMSVADLIRYQEKGSKQDLMNDLVKLEDEANLQGIKIKLRPEIYYSAKIYKDDTSKCATVQTKMCYNYDAGDDASFVEGSKPKYANEMAITTMVADRLNVSVGDTIHCKANNKEDSFIVSGLYQSMNNLGVAGMWNKDYNLIPNNFAFMNVVGSFTDSMTDDQKIENIEKLKNVFTNCKISTREEQMQDGMGGYTKQLAPMKSSILLIVLAINLLITILTTRMLLSREIAEIAILKSMGMKSRTICRQQVLRIVIVLILAVIVGSALSGFVGNALSGQIFKMIGVTQISLNVNPIMVYGFYPLAMLIVIVFGVLTSTTGIWKVKVWESAE
jgi:putative ABC transport system permease protein